MTDTDRAADMLGVLVVLLLAAAAVAAGVRWHVRRQLGPLAEAADLAYLHYSTEGPDE